jgi:hypothetical protein
VGICGHRLRKPARQLELGRSRKSLLGSGDRKITFTTFNSESLFDRRFEKKIQIRGSVSVCATVNTLSETSERADDQVLYLQRGVGWVLPVGEARHPGGQMLFQE